VSGRRRLALVAVAAGVAFVGFLIARRAGVGPPSSARTETVPASAPVSSEVAPAVAGAVRARLPSLPSLPSAPDEAPAALTPLGASRALEAISKNEQTRQLFARLQRLGLSREQRDRVLLILGTQALRPAEESPTLVALRASGGSRVLSDEEANRVRDERQQIAERALRPLRPALAAVLTPSQLARAGLGGDDTAAASTGDRRAGGGYRE
jgi:hypothetical protein